MKTIEQPKGKFPSRLGSLEYCLESPTEVRIRTSRPKDSDPTHGQFVTIRNHKYYFSVSLSLPQKDSGWQDNRSLYVSAQSLSEPDPSKAVKETILEQTIKAWEVFIKKNPFVLIQAGRYARWFKLHQLISARDAKQNQIATLQSEIQTINEQINATI